MPHDQHDAQAPHRSDSQGCFAYGSQRKDRPTDDPGPEVIGMMILAKEKKQNQQNNGGRGFKESDA